MGLSSSELYLVLRARDEASRILRNFAGNVNNLSDDAMRHAQAQFAQGQALATVGVAVAGAGILGAAALNGMADAAANYNQQAALTLTQTDTVAVSLEQLKDIGREVAKDIPVAFEEIQAGMYDIFSSMEVSLEDSKLLIREISKAAVGGQVDVSTAARGTISILNAYKMEAEDVTKVNDLMFQLVRKGVGTYEEFTNTIGRAVPSAVKAGQSVENLAGMMAFLTRNGQSTAMAATASARALDAMANPKTIKRFEEMGIEVTKSDGSFRNMNDIMTDLKDSMAGMDEEAKAANLNALFKGSGGTIQAMRFFNLAVSDGNGLLNEMQGYMDDAGGAAGEAYDIMSKTPQAELQRLTNNYEVLKTEIGDQVLPMKIKLMQAMVDLIQLFEKMPGPIRDNIGIILSLVSGFLVLTGIVLAVAGIWLMFSAGVVLAGTTMAAVLTPIGLVIAAFVALVAIGFLIYKNWDTIKAKAVEVWDGYIWPAIMKGKQILTDIWNAIFPLVKLIGTDLANAGKKLWVTIGPSLMQIWTTIQNGAASVKAGLLDFWDSVKGPLAQLGTSLAPFGKAVVELATRLWKGLQPIVNFLVAVLGPVFVAVFGLISGVVKGVFEGVKQLFRALGDIFAGLIGIVQGVVDFVVALVNGEWGAAWTALGDIVQSIWNTIYAILRGAWNIVYGIVKGIITGIIDFFTHLWDVLVGHSIIPDMINAIIKWFQSLPGKVLAFIRGLVINAIQWFLSMKEKVSDNIARLVIAVLMKWAEFKAKVISTIVSVVAYVISKVTEWKNNFVSNVTSMVNQAIAFFTGLPGRIKAAISGIGSWLFQSGKDLVQGLINGVKNMASNVATAAKDVVGSAIDAAKAVLDIGSPSRVFRYFGEMSGEGLVVGMENMLRDVANAGGNLAAAAITSPPVVSAALGTGGTGNAYAAVGTGGGRNFYQDITINTNEIDPLAHAAELGFILSERVG